MGSHVCDLEEGMGNPAYFYTPEFNGVSNPHPANVFPGGVGVTFTSTTNMISIEVKPSNHPIIEYVSIADPTITNVNKITVSILRPDGSNLLTVSSLPGSLNVTGFPNTPLQPGSTIILTFETADGRPAQNVTISILGCFHPEKVTKSTTSTTSAPKSRSTTTPG